MPAQKSSSVETVIETLLQSLARTVREKLLRHPQGHLAFEGRPAGEKDHLELLLRIPVGTSDAAIGDAAGEAERALEEEVEALLAERALLRPGRILCLRCRTSECEHAAPRSSREVFAGYVATGLPRFVDYGQWLLERGHPRLDEIYRPPRPGVPRRHGNGEAPRRAPGLVTEVVSGRELTEELLPAYRDPDYRVHGEVTAGYFQVPQLPAGTAALALTFVILSTARHRDKRHPKRHRETRREHRHGRRLTLQILGTGPQGEPLASLYERLPNVPWQGVAAWGQQVLQTIEKSQGSKKSTPASLSGRVEGLLRSMGRRLEQERRARGRRTGHAEKRHRQGDRPTRMARADLARGEPESFFVDERRSTVVVLGERGRAHVWSDAGKLVTSIRYSAESIEKKLRQEVWRKATAEEVANLRRRVADGED